MKTPLLLILAAGALLAAAHSPSSAHDFVPPDTLVFAPDSNSFLMSADWDRETTLGEGETEDWLRAPFGDGLLTDADQWRSRRAPRRNQLEPTLDYNRVDLVRYGARWEIQAPETMYPRIGARFEYATGRKRTLYGVQFEQPLLPTARFVFGVSMVRRTDHSELQQVDDLENSLALLFGRQDYRDYFEREGYGAYLSWRVPDFSTVSVHARNDDFRSLTASDDTRSWFHAKRSLRPNPPIEEGVSHAMVVRLERLAHRTRRTRAGLYHWIELERSGGKLGGHFDYTRALADVRSVLQLSPAVSLSLRGVAGFTPQGELPPQKEFTAGGVDGLRAHAFSKFRGDQLALAQAEYSVGLWNLRAGNYEGGLHAIAFVDAGRAWSSSRNRWDLDRQHVAVDGGFGVATSDDNLRVYFARDLQNPDASFVTSLRLQRPF